MQEEIIDILSKEKEPMALIDLAKLLNKREQHISMRLSKMIKYKEVSFIMLSRTESLTKYKVMKPIRLYYLSKKWNLKV